MIANYFKTSSRNLWRNRQFSIINISGLALGITVFLLIIQYVAFEWSANRFHKNYNELYRANVLYKEGNSDYYLPPGFAPAIKQNVAGIENYVRVADGIGGGVVRLQAVSYTGEKSFSVNDMLYVDGSFFDVFSFPVLRGTPSLKKPQTLALRDDLAKKFFGTADAIGQTLEISNQFGNTLYTVASVFSVPGNSDIKASVLLSLHTLESAANRDGNDWADPNTKESGFTNIYLQLAKGSDHMGVSNNINRYVKSVNPASKDDVVVLQPFSQLHLAPSFDYPFQTFGSLLLVFVFACVAVLILLIAWVNYINLSTAQSLSRAREVGVRKVLGASRKQLVVQFLTETFIITFLAVAISLTMVTFFQQTFNEFTGKELSLAVLSKGNFWLFGVLLLIAGSLLSGAYVAFTLTKYRPVRTVRGKVQPAVKSFSLRKSLVVFQFTISIVFIIATVILYKQLKYMQTEKLGMNLEQLLVIKGPTVSSEDQAARNDMFKDELARLPFVSKYAASNNVPGIGYNFSANGITKSNPQKGDEKKSYSMFIADHRFFDTYEIPFAQGTAFSKNDADRSWNNVKKVILNETAARTLGFGRNENIVGKKILWGDPFEVIGVVKDYHHVSLREPIKPTVYLASVSYSYFTIKTGVDNMASKINTIKGIYNKTFLNNPFEYFFADEQYDQQYAQDQKLGSVFIASALVAILIACMGLFGLSAFSARQRIKEIGIRKVLGAGISDITTLLSRDFIVLVFIAIVIASPLAWWGMHEWLQAFAYRTEISWWVFFLAGALAIMIALFTISFQSIRAAIANPVESLRAE
ncbi:MAG TPA: ABC transporter permease [Chitinophagaceae bacterium]|nr:ABC transporter permease [Chitinophagaceae bacterium]